jgi:hypothetical protein
MTQLTPAKYAKFVAAVTCRLVAARSPRHLALSLSDHLVPGFSPAHCSARIWNPMCLNPSRATPRSQRCLRMSTQYDHSTLNASSRAQQSGLSWHSRSESRPALPRDLALGLLSVSVMLPPVSPSTHRAKVCMVFPKKSLKAVLFRGRLSSTSSHFSHRACCPRVAFLMIVVRKSFFVGRPV